MESTTERTLAQRYVELIFDTLEDIKYQYPTTEETNDNFSRMQKDIETTLFKFDLLSKISPLAISKDEKYTNLLERTRFIYEYLFKDGSYATLHSKNRFLDIAFEMKAYDKDGKLRCFQISTI